MCAFVHARQSLDKAKAIEMDTQRCSSQQTVCSAAGSARTVNRRYIADFVRKAARTKASAGNMLQPVLTDGQMNSVCSQWMLACALDVLYSWRIVIHCMIHCASQQC